ncbi:MAG: flavin reductase family protein [Candidatus Bathyarchaeia archaeon]|jgi:flavin reductase (DIM6/NTAB) family NADH-FMN oxidoreductase RutF
MIEIPIAKATQLISPRLTVLVNTIDETGELNSSPYSWVYPLSMNPPLIGVGIGGKHKFTYVNSMRTGEFVVCVVSEAFGQQAVGCEAAHRPGSKLWERQGLHAEKSVNVKVPRIRESNAILECRVKQFIELSGDHLILVGEVVHAEAKQTGLDDIDPLLHDGGGRFRTIGKQIILERQQ